MIVVYKIKNDKIISIARKADDYVLQTNEYSSDIWYQKPFFNGAAVIESITQQEIDERAELEQENEYLRQTIAQLDNGNDLAKEIFSFVRKHTGLTTNQKSVLKSLAVQLFSGQIEEALNDWGNISRPTTANKMQIVYDKLKVKFDTL